MARGWKVRWMFPWMIPWLVLLLAAALWPAATGAGIVCGVAGVVTGVDLTDPASPLVTVAPSTPSAPSTKGAEGSEQKGPEPVTLVVPFTTTESGCIDWSMERNRRMAFVLGLAPGQAVEARYSSSDRGADRIPVTGIHAVAPPPEAPFRGMEKIVDPELLAALRPADEPRVSVVVVLRKPETGSEIEGSDGKDTDAAAFDRVRRSVLDSVPKGGFAPGTMLENAPVLMGEATLGGLKALAAHPMVSAIEMNRPMGLHPPGAPEETEETEQTDEKEE